MVLLANMMSRNLPNIVWEGTILDRNFWIAIIRVGIFWWEFSRWEFSRWELSWVGIFWVGVTLGGNCPGGGYPGWELSGWELRWEGIFFGGGFPGGNFPVGSFPSTCVLTSIHFFFGYETDSISTQIFCHEKLFHYHNNSL